MDWNIEIFKVFSAFAGGVFMKLVGGYDPMMNFLLFIMLFDIISGFSNSLYNNIKLNSNIMFKGSIKKISILLVVAVAVQIDTTFNTSIPLREIVITYYIIQEGISFSQNISSFMNLPKGFTQFFDKIGKDDKKSE